MREREPRRRLAKNRVGEEMGCNAGRRSMLVLDEFRGRSTEKVESCLVKHRGDLVVIPGGTMCVLQPSDVCLNKSFEAHLKRMYTEWIAQGLYEPMPMGRIRKTGKPLLCQWIVDAWKAVPGEIVRNSFKKCCVGNSLDGTDDNAVWDNKSASDEGASDRGSSDSSDE